MKIPTATEFADRTCLLVDVLLQPVIEGTALPAEDVRWFCDHCDQRIRYYYATKPDWRAWLDDKRVHIDPRKQCQVWFRHWFAAYRQDPELYRANFAMTS